jgi:hypothetical protein
LLAVTAEERFVYIVQKTILPYLYKFAVIPFPAVVVEPTDNLSYFPFIAEIEAIA